MNRQERRTYIEKQARHRAVKGWVFRLRGVRDKPDEFTINHWAVHTDPKNCQRCRWVVSWQADMDEARAIREFLEGGECPERYMRAYAAARKQLGLT